MTETYRKEGVTLVQEKTEVTEQYHDVESLIATKEALQKEIADIDLLLAEAKKLGLQ